MQKEMSMMSLINVLLGVAFRVTVWTAEGEVGQNRTQSHSSKTAKQEKSETGSGSLHFWIHDSAIRQQDIVCHFSVYLKRIISL